MRLAEVNRIAREQGCRVKLISVQGHVDNAFSALSDGKHETALEFIRAASAQLDEVMPCAA
jgi:hypothetical protein